MVVEPHFIVGIDLYLILLRRRKLLDREAFYPGDEGVVEIAFLIRRALGDNFSEGTKFTFGEGRKHVGEGEVKEILELE